MKAKRLILTSLALVAATAILTIASAFVSHEYPPPSNDSSRVTSNYFDPKYLEPSLIYQWQQRSDSGQKDGFTCLALRLPTQTDAQGWPFAYRFRVDYGCPGTYSTFAPLALAADLVIFLTASIIAVVGIPRLRRRTSH
jgi:hypothetical protein